jgi:YhcH/YjgK/YiaL family protein
MIYDKISNYKKYNLGEAFTDAFAHALTLDASSPVGSTQIQPAVKAAIAEYTTKLQADAKPETHRRFIDIQIVLAGEELIGWYPDGSLKVSEPYDTERDVEFYTQAQVLVRDCLLSMKPGYFTIFYPWDVHMPQVCVDDKPAKVKKLVYKIAI